MWYFLSFSFNRVVEADEIESEREREGVIDSDAVAVVPTHTQFVPLLLLLLVLLFGNVCQQATSSTQLTKDPNTCTLWQEPSLGFCASNRIDQTYIKHYD